ncbi:MAG: hypothetical protein OEZ45_10720 [Candidatus Aminicenantes bacterium]|nr:hypothetical protein [Candidatus Aminicenantes bacterium]
MKKEDKLIEVATVFSKDVLEHAVLCARKFKKNYRKIFPRLERFFLIKRMSGHEMKDMFFQFVFLFYYVVDRFAFGVLKSDDKKAFRSILWIDLFESPLMKEPLTEMSEYRKSLMDLYSDFIKRYQNCESLYGNSVEKLENTLVFEFSKDISRLTNRPNDIRIVTFCYSLVMDSIMELRIMERLGGIE